MSVEILARVFDLVGGSDNREALTVRTNNPLLNLEFVFRLAVRRRSRVNYFGDRYIQGER